MAIILRWTFWLMVVTLPVGEYAQARQGQTLVDSLLAEMQTDAYRKSHDSNKIMVLNDLSFNIRFTDPDAGIKYAWQAIKLSEASSWKFGLSMAYNSLSVCYSANSNDSLAIVYAIKAMQLYEQRGHKKGVASNLGNISVYYRRLSNYAKAQEYAFRALKISEELGDRKLSAGIIQSIGANYHVMKNHNKASEYYKTALSIKREIGDKTGEAACLINMGINYIEMDSLSLGLQYTLEAMKLYSEMGNKYGLQATLTNAGEAHFKMGDYIKALEEARKAIALCEEIGDSSSLAGAANTAGMAYMALAKNNIHVRRVAYIPNSKNARIAMAMQLFSRSVKLSRNLNDMSILLPALKNLSEVQKLTGDYEAAFANKEEYIRIKDSVFTIENNEKLAAMETERANQLKEKQIEINRQQIAIDRLAVQKKRNEGVFYIAGIGILVIVVVVIARYYRRQILTNRLLKEEKIKSDGLMVDLTDTLKQKDMLMKEIHHRVKNNLQLISSMLDLQLNVTKDEGSKEAMTESALRVRSISLIHQQLYQNEEITTIEFGHFVAEMATHLNSAFAKPGQQIRLEANVPEIMLDVDTAVPLGLILNELMTNSYKYAFTGNDGFIKIAVTAHATYYELIYADSGPGLPADFDHEKAKSLGLRVIRGLSRQLRGKFGYEVVKKQFSITFKA